MKSKYLLTAALIFAASTSFVSAGINITVYPASAPNSFGSPNWNDWVNNAISALDSGASSAGTAGTPSYYSQIPNGSTLQISDNIVTNFNSWRGDANPTATYGAAYGSELGNRLQFGLAIIGTSGTQFSISELSFNGTSSDGGLNFAFAAGAYQYSTNYVGILYGANGVLGGGDDTFITAGLNTQMVDAVIGRGSGNAYAVYDTDPGATNQDKINNALADIDPYTFTGTYSLESATGSATVAFVPEPSSFSLGLLGLSSLIGVGYFRRMRRA